MSTLLKLITYKTKQQKKRENIAFLRAVILILSAVKRNAKNSWARKMLNPGKVMKGLNLDVSVEVDLKTFWEKENIFFFLTLSAFPRLIFSVLN